MSIPKERLSAQPNDIHPLAPGDLGLNACFRCGRRFREGDLLHRGATAGPAGILFFVVCAQCAAVVTGDTKAGEAFSDTLRDRFRDEALAAAPVGGCA